MNDAAAPLGTNGKVVSVRGSVVDGRFDACLPPIHTILRAKHNGGISIEVVTQLDRHHVRGVALNPTEGLAKGDALENTG
ncbi:MAG: F-type H+-transporting ATPase subunit beta, partial [Verrucomicrobiales bacterium]